MKRDEKQRQAEVLRQELEKARTVILSSFEGLTVAQDSELRHKVAEAGAKYKVVKNSLIERAAQGTTTEPIAQKIRGTTSVAFTDADPVVLAKTLTAYAKQNPALVFKSGIVEGRVVSLADVAMIANLPSRSDLLSRALFLINSQGQHLASAISGVSRNLVSVIEHAVKEKKFKES